MDYEYVTPLGLYLFNIFLCVMKFFYFVNAFYYSDTSKLPPWGIEGSIK